MVERDGFTVYVEVIYERLSEYCNHCYSIRQSVAHSCKLHPQEKSVEKTIKVQAEKQALVIDLEKQQHASSNNNNNDTDVNHNKDE
jgi:hypothetical protein